MLNIYFTVLKVFPQFQNQDNRVWYDSVSDTSDTSGFWTLRRQFTDRWEQGYNIEIHDCYNWPGVIKIVQI